MKKALKITAITLGSLILLLLIVVGVVMWLVLTPERLTPIVKQQAEKYITCQTELDNVELTIFKTFPQIGLQLNNLVLINPMNGAPSDTLAAIGECVVALNISELINNKSIIVNEFYLSNGTANVFIDSAGNANFDVFKIESDDEDTSSFKLGKMDLDKIKLDNVSLTYTDLSSKMNATVNNLNATAKGNMQDEVATVVLKLQTGYAAFALLDSIPITITTNGVNTEIDGYMADFDAIKGDLKLALKDVSFKMGDECYLQKAQLMVNTPLDLSINTQNIILNKAEVLLNQYQIHLDGEVSRNESNGDIAMDVAFKTNRWSIEEVLELIPASLKSAIKEMAVGGNLTLSGRATGTYNDTSMPLISADILLDKGSFAMKDIPFTFNDIYADINTTLNLQSASNVRIRNFRAKTGSSTVQCSGTVNDVMNTMLCNLKLNANLNLPELQPVIPDDIKVNMKGFANTSLQANFTLDQITNMDLEKIKVNGWIDFTNLDILYNDSIAIKTPATHIALQLPSTSGNANFKELLSARIESKQLNADMVGLLSAGLKDTKLDVSVSNFMDSNAMLSVACNFDFSRLDMTMDTLVVGIDKPSGNFAMYPSAANKNIPALDYTYQSDYLSAKMGSALSVVSKNISLKGTAQYDERQKDPILQFDPRLKIDFQQGVLNLASFPVPIEIPSIKSNFTPERFTIRESRVILGNSDFKLSGIITNIDKYVKETGLLKANLKFVSDHTDVTQLMNLVNGLGVEDSLSASQDLESPEDDPFIVPMGMDIELHTLIKKATVKETEIRNIEGSLTIKDGILILEEMGFTSDAARMQLTAMYRSSRKNHLYAGVDFHLLDIDIAKLIKMIPDIDTIVPMLKSFAGNAAFHFAFETYLKSNYELKYSTLRGAAAINGQDLVLMDSETFSKISKYLLFKKKTSNKVDSISVEMTIFRNEVELFPFVVSLDRYKAILQGKYNLDNTGNYRIFLSDTPLPLRLGLKIDGPTDKLKYKVNLFPRLSPSYRMNVNKQGVVDDKILELKQIINQSLQRSVKELE